MSIKRRLKVAIVGGGISGLSTAYFLEKLATEQGCFVDIDLFEATDRCGGKIASIQSENGLLLELGAESFLSRKRAGMELCQDLGLDKDLRGTRPENRRTFVWREGAMHRLPEGLSGFVPGKLSALATSSLLSFGGKMRVALDLMKPANRNPADESLAQFISRRIGKQAYQRLVQPLLCGIYCGDGDQLSTNATYPELKELERQHGSLIRGLNRRKDRLGNPDQGQAPPPFVTLPRGMTQLVDQLREKLLSTKFHLDVAIREIEHVKPGFRVLDDDAKPIPFDGVVLTVPAFVAADILRNLPGAHVENLTRIPHVSTATINLWYEKQAVSAPLNGYGFVIPSDQQEILTAATWTSSKHFDRAPDHLHLVRGYAGRAGNEIDPRIEEPELLQRVQKDLERTMSLKARPVGYRIQHWPKGSPQYTMGHLERLAKIDESLRNYPGLYLTGSSYRGVGIPDCIRNAKLTAEQLITQRNEQA